MISAPSFGLVGIGGLVLAPTFCAICAWIAQWRYRRALSIVLGKPISAIVAPPLDHRIQLMMVLGVGLGSLAMFTAPQDMVTGQVAGWRAILRWVALAGIVLAMVNAVRLAWVGMPPESNFWLDGGVVEELDGKAKGAIPTTGGAADLLDAREF